MVRRSEDSGPVSLTLEPALLERPGDDLATTIGPRDRGHSDADRLDAAVHRLQRIRPEASAARPLAPWQRRALWLVLMSGCLGLLLAPVATQVAIFILASAASLALALARLMALGALIDRRPEPAAPSGPVASPAPSPPLPLPTYTILVPLYREAASVPNLIAALDALDYPDDRVQILLIVEATDPATAAAIRAVGSRRTMRLILVPDGTPRTKPRALNFGLTFATGDLIVIFDAEDQPEADQLRKAAVRFATEDARLGCLQARLNVYNPDASPLTRQFAIEYSALFDALLPTFERTGLPVLIGGTSNHFPRAALDAVCGWDPFNVTEDADLALRLNRAGYRIGTLDSTTWEEAPETFAVWKGQRTRWLKGWMQTYLVHMREPARLWRELGTRQFLGFQMLTGGVVLSAIVHPWFYAALAWAVLQGPAASGGAWSAPTLVWGLAILHLVVCCAAAMALGAAAVTARGRGWLWPHALLLPIYWLAISFAAYRALFQFLSAPHQWEKTTHSGRIPATGADGRRTRASADPPA